ncbi:hypothetical protein J5U23_00891 [Saccharolobus shibatae B12]|uniref:Thermopsin n=1 Tax=Saccharolobus shibatae (strain ATCC 51178 / DSM 5389 / JCM 8931 / NBRC 15437 / B12) TaxID=523848 RepID=A0A8F5BMH8_SACSH|nr:hypothetical protein [Saccharolobus shibatae]QXJ28023.1 hypothetical protein J5U23_00891 [Saccharolobus shibatae B12]
MILIYSTTEESSVGKTLKKFYIKTKNMEWRVIIITILLIISLIPLTSVYHSNAKPLPLSPLNSNDPGITFYDEQIFMALNAYPVSTNLIAYVKVISQTSDSGYGPAYLLNAITNNDWWYQIGVAYNWPYTNGSFDPGFHMIYMVWNSSGDSVIGPVLLSFNGNVNNGDEIMLEIEISNGNIVLSAYDNSTGAKAVATVNANGASSIVTDLNFLHGYITGLMTEWYHLRAYFGGELGVVYRLQYLTTSFTLGINEMYLTSPPQSIASNEVAYSVSNNYTFYDLSYIGAYAASNGYYFITGDLYPIFLNYKVIGGSFNIPINVTYFYDSFKETVRLPSLIFVDSNSNISLPSMVLNGLSRIVSLNSTPILANRSGNLTVYYQLQYFININVPVNASINGIYTTLSSGWYNASIKVAISPFTYYPNSSRIMVFSYPTSQFTLNNPINLTVTYILQYYVHVNSLIPLFGSINGTNSTIFSGWYNQNTIIQIYNITFYQSNETRAIITKILPANKILVNMSYTITVDELVQYYIAVKSQIPIYALINGSNNTLTSNWYNRGTTINVENITYYGPNNEYRDIIIAILPSKNITVENPVTISIITVKQYPLTVYSKVPVYALVNGTNETLQKYSWFNTGSRIQIENITYYINSTARLLMEKVLPYSNFTLLQPINITIITLPQYFLNVSSNYPVYIFFNGKNATLSNGWYNNGTEIELYPTWYINQTERQHLVSISLNGKSTSVAVIIINEPISLKLQYVLQYYIDLISNIPIKALINSTLVTFSPGWYNTGTPISFVNMSYYVSNNTRYVILSIVPFNFTVNRSITVKVTTIKEYLVTVNTPVLITILNRTVNTSEIWVPAGQIISISKYVNISNNVRIFYNTTSYLINVTQPTNINVKPVKEYLVTINGSSEWLPSGSVITLTHSIPIYEQGKWIGTYNVTNGMTITVNEPITETLVKTVNGTFIGGIVIVIAIVILGILLLTIRRSRPKF